MKTERPLIRRTFLQERFMVLLKKQLNGKATFNDLIELDEIINRDPKLRGIILEEMQETNEPTPDNGPPDIIQNMPGVKKSCIFDRIKEFFGRLFIIDYKPELYTSIS